MFKARDKRRFQELENYLAECEPNLKLILDELAAKAGITGAISVAVGGGRVEFFEIAIRFHGLNPWKVPDTFAAGERFPRAVPDRHINSDGSFCMWLPMLEPQDFDHREGLAKHLARIRSFIQLQLMYEDRERRGIRPFWPGPQWGHGESGYREWLRESSRDLSPSQLHAFGYYLLHPEERIYSCPCASRKRFASCHAHWFAQLKRANRLSPAIMKELLEQVSDLSKNRGGRTE